MMKKEEDMTDAELMVSIVNTAAQEAQELSMREFGSKGTFHGIDALRMLAKMYLMERMLKDARSAVEEIMKQRSNAAGPAIKHIYAGCNEIQLAVYSFDGVKK